MYPLNMSNAAAGGFAVANDEAEHKALTACGYEPAFAGAPDSKDQATEETADSLRAKLDAACIAYDKRWGLAKLAEALKGAA